ncbi:MAG: TonB-dependent receptor plug domain-containing protein [Bdellovibrionales bacterium]|nr:TonB-dependent receptor plug domain-containing protein [Bdellovibrionales bacterium]
MKKQLWVGLAGLMNLMIASSALGAATVKVRLLEKGTRAPIVDANVFILPAKVKGTSDSRGDATLENVPSGPVQIVVNVAGYARFEQNDLIPENGTYEIGTFFVERTSYLAYETTVYGKGKRRDDSLKTLGQSDFKVAGSGGDPVRAVQNLPGVNRASGIGAQVIIQGSAPNQTRYMIDNHEVPIIFHFGGLSSVVMPEALDRVDYLSAGFGPEYGRALGGLVGVWTKEPRKDRLGGFAYIDSFNAGAQIEGQVGEPEPTPSGEPKKDPKHSYLFSARQSYIGALLRAFAPKDSSFNLTVAPEFRDLTGVWQSRLNERDTFRLTAVGSQDTLEFLLKEPVEQDPSIRGSFSNRTSFYRFIPQWTRKYSDDRFFRASLGFGEDNIKVNVGEDFFLLDVTQLTSRAEYEFKPESNWTTVLGMDNRFRFATVDFKLPTFNNDGGVTSPLSVGETRDARVSTSYADFGIYSRNIFTFNDERFSVLPSARVDYMNQTKEILPVPRLALRYKNSEALSFKTSGGLYYQAPQEQESSPSFGNPNLKAPRAWHAALSGDLDFREGSTEGWTLATGPFYRSFDRLVVPSRGYVAGTTQSENYKNGGTGRAYGGEVLLKYQSRKLNGWLAYTLSRSTRTNPGQSEALFAFDQTHLMTALGSIDLAGNWRISTRVRYVTGNPKTPVVGGVLDADNDVFIPVRGSFFSQRLEPFFQLDLRIDKKWIYDKWILSAYLEVLNATNRMNLENVAYSYDFKQSQKVSGIPILPFLGVKGEF